LYVDVNGKEHVLKIAEIEKMLTKEDKSNMRKNFIE